MDNVGKKPLPDPGDRDLIPPDMDYIYFNHAEKFPLEPESTGYSAVNAWWFAECAFLAYCHPGFSRMAYRLAGFPGFHFFQGKGTECVVSWSEEVAIVSFRGTELKSRSALHEIRTDLNAVPAAFQAGGRVHKGFLDGLEEIWSGDDGLQAFLKILQDEQVRRPLWITGHSLGGALAALCFARLPGAAGLYLYGAPRIGDRAFVELLKGRPVWRIENAGDPVPLIPPDIPSIRFDFKDLGTLKFLSSEGTVLDKRPVFVLEDQKTKYRKAKKVLDERLKDIRESLTPGKKDREAPEQVLDRIKEHFQLTGKEWKSHMDEFLNEFGLKVDHHQPIFYAIKTWNALLDR